LWDADPENIGFIKTIRTYYIARLPSLIEVLWHDGRGRCLFAKRLERGRFIWPSPADGTVAITPAQLGYLLRRRALLILLLA
jgi:transposase